MVTAIDYTASNGDPNSPQSLHSMGPQNQYIQALHNVGGIIEPYDSDRTFPCFGFGGIPRMMGSAVSHCFPINGNLQNPEIFGVENIVAMYQQTLPNITLAGPTLFAPLLEQFLNYTR